MLTTCYKQQKARRRAALASQIPGTPKQALAAHPCRASLLPSANTKPLLHVHLQIRLMSKKSTNPLVTHHHLMQIYALGRPKLLCTLRAAYQHAEMLGSCSGAKFGSAPSMSTTPVPMI
jgi:hypothetical protein